MPSQAVWTEIAPERISVPPANHAEPRPVTLALNIAIGTAMISLSVIVHTFGLIVITWVMTHVVARFRMHGRRSRIVAMVSVVLGLFALMTVEVWGWAILYLALDAVPDLETALYLSAATFATVGYGDVVAHAEWRLLSALEGLNGFLLIGWSTAYLVAAGMRIGPFKPGEHF